MYEPVELKVPGGAVVFGPAEEMRKVCEGTFFVDLREVEDFCVDPKAYKEVLEEAFNKLNSFGKACFGCDSGCGRTFTALSMLISLISKNPHEAMELFREALLLKLRNGDPRPCPELPAQEAIAGLSLLGAGKFSSPTELVEHLRSHVLAESCEEAELDEEAEEASRCVRCAFKGLGL